MQIQAQAQARLPQLFFLQLSSFTLTSIPARCGTQLRSVVLYQPLQTVSPFSAFLCTSSLTHTRAYQLRNFSRKFDPPRPKDVCPILSETSAISPAVINLPTRARTNCLPFQNQIANDEDKRQVTQYHVYGGRSGGVTGF